MPPMQDTTTQRSAGSDRDYYRTRYNTFAREFWAPRPGKSGFEICLVRDVARTASWKEMSERLVSFR